ncbi:MAG: hypothetical protein ACTHOR_20185 [Devosia sp.]
MTTDHRARAAALRDRAEGSGGETAGSLRRAVLARAAGGAAVAPPYDALVADVAEASHRVTDAEVAAVRAAAGGDKAAFEVVMTAAIGAALLRFERAMEVLEEADRAAR